MKSSLLEIKAALQILKPVNEVFEAIADPEKMSNYFISRGSGRMEEGKNLIWKFPESNMDIPLKVGKVEKNKYISYQWDGENGEVLLVELFLEPYKEDYTIVTVTEKSMENNEAGINWLKGNTEGWANFLACLKAFLEYGINLRNGAFEWRFEK